jgi:hypothetical protein
MNSVSTNPFDDDDEADINSIASNVSHSQGRRKKRRAPLPPVSFLDIRAAIKISYLISLSAYIIITIKMSEHEIGVLSNFG